MRVFLAGTGSHQASATAAHQGSVVCVCVCVFYAAGCGFRCDVAATGAGSRREGLVGCAGQCAVWSPFCQWVAATCAHALHAERTHPRIRPFRTSGPSAHPALPRLPMYVHTITVTVSYRPSGARPEGQGAGIRTNSKDYNDWRGIQHARGEWWVCQAVVLALAVYVCARVDVHVRLCLMDLSLRPVI